MIHTASKVRLIVGFLLYLASCTGVVGLMLVLPENRWVRATLVGVALLATVLFMVSYHVGTRGYWRRSDIGVHLMTFALADAIVLAYVAAAFLGWIPLAVLPYLSALTYLTIAWLFGWRTVIMRGYLRGGGK
jgi:hypothetical protein